MINVKSKKCCVCIRFALYNIEGEPPMYCHDHKTDTMVNVLSKRCLKCSLHPSFGMEGGPVLYCDSHKLEGMINLITKRCLKCDIRACFNTEDEPPLYCFLHKKEGMVNLIGKKCLECNITEVHNQKYKGYCARCYINLFPDEPVARNYKVKEQHVFDAVLELLPKDLNVTRDKRTGGCSKRRPDLMIDLGSHWICGENDEDAHKDYDNSCENKRTMELYTDMGNRSMILIRFNCDKYSEGESLFKTCKQTGISLIRSKEEFAERIGKFAELINKYILSEPPEKAITTEYLYYDELDSI